MTRRVRLSMWATFFLLVGGCATVGPVAIPVPSQFTMRMPMDELSAPATIVAVTETLEGCGRLRRIAAEMGPAAAEVGACQPTEVGGPVGREFRVTTASIPTFGGRVRARFVQQNHVDCAAMRALTVREIRAYGIQVNEVTACGVS